MITTQRAHFVSSSTFIHTTFAIVNVTVSNFNTGQRREYVLNILASKLFVSLPYLSLKQERMKTMHILTVP